MEEKRTLKQRLTENPLWSAVIISLIIGGVITICLAIKGICSADGPLLRSIMEGLFSAGVVFLLVSGCVAAPVVLSFYNIYLLFVSSTAVERQHAGRQIEYITISYGAVCTFLWCSLKEIVWSADWWEQLENTQIHPPIATWTWPTLLTVAAVALAGYLLLRRKEISRLPPLLAVLALGGVYLGAGLCIVWMIQVAQKDQILCVYPANLLLIAAKVVKETILDWNRAEHEPLAGKCRLIRFLNGVMNQALSWPFLGVLFALPLLGVIVAVLTLFGQAPDSIIQAWTQTSDWTLSQQVAPQNIYYDMHYLCTVAAGGHQKVVKPLREGKRHGHRVLVNRQLCVANAFEQLLQERLPRLHRVIRHAYDRYGYPIAKHIRTPYAADAVWFLMKPLEWLFLAVLYLFDEKPENRIAVQYPHAPLPVTDERR